MPPIAGIIVGVVFGVGMIGGLAAWWFLKRRKAAKSYETVENNFDTLNAAPG
jgi:LPXTG-motif cell wall-anchored protein